MSKRRIKPGDWAWYVGGQWDEFIYNGVLVVVTKDDGTNIPFCFQPVLTNTSFTNGYWAEEDELKLAYSPTEVQREQATKPPQAPVPHTESGVPKP